MSSEEAKPWERQDGESQEAYEAFTAYLEMGATRSLAKVGELLVSPEYPGGKSRQLMEKFSARDRWQYRILAYDRMMAREITNRVVVGTAEMRERQARQGMNMTARAAARFMSMSAEEIKKLPVGQAVAVARMGMEMEQRARAVSAEELALQEREDVPRFTIKFIGGAPDDMVCVRLGETIGYIPKDRVDEFKADWPEATVVI